jgi:ferredoxin
VTDRPAFKAGTLMSEPFTVFVDPGKCKGCHLCICVASPVFSDSTDPKRSLPVLLSPQEYQGYERDIECAVEYCPEEAITMTYPAHRRTARGIEPTAGESPRKD